MIYLRLPQKTCFFIRSNNLSNVKRPRIKLDWDLIITDYFDEFNHPYVLKIGLG